MPMFIHMKTVPGVAVMTPRHDRIAYTKSALQRDGLAERLTWLPLGLPPATALSRVPGSGT
jgi:hypothetical protein